MESERIRLERDIKILCGKSQDPDYTKYLESLLLLLRQGMASEAYVMAEVNRTYPLYQRRMGIGQMQQAVPQCGQKYGQQEQYIQMQPPVPQAWGAMPAAQFQQTASWQPWQVQQTALQGQYRQTPQSALQQIQPQQQYIPYPSAVQVQPVLQQNAYPQYIYPPQPAQGQPVQPPAKKKKNVEFAVGAGVLSVIGILFVLVALVMLGIHYMNGMVKGMCLYGIAVVILLFSEWYLEKKQRKIAVGVTGVSVGSLYLFTMINYLYFKNFNIWVAVGILLLISVLAVLLGRKRDWGGFPIISLAGSYICIFPISAVLSGVQGSGQAVHFGVIAFSVLVLNLLIVFVPVKKNRTLVNIVHLTANAVFSAAFIYLVFQDMENFSYLLFFLASALFVQGLVFYQLEKPYFDSGQHKGRAGNVAVYAVTASLLLMCFVALSLLAVRDGFALLFRLASGVLLLVCAVLFLLFRKSSLKWIQYWLLCPTLLLAYNLHIYVTEDGFVRVFLHRSGSEGWWGMGVTLAVFVLAKLLSRQKNLKVSELLITLFAALQAVAAFAEYDMLCQVSSLYPEKQADMAAGYFRGLCFMGFFLLSLAALYYWKSIYEEIVMGVLGAFIGILFQNELTLAVLICILFAGVICFNSADFFRGKHIRIFNYVNLALMACLYLAAAFVKNHIAYGILLVLGVSFMVLAFREKFGMDFKTKHIIFVLFLCYMVLIWDIPVPVLKSLLFMVIAIGTVAAGFALRQKKLRVTGLILTLAACAKVVLYDFEGAKTAEKIILFLIAGLIALAISGIYLALEKKIV